MPKISQPKISATKPRHACDICGVTVSRRADLARHRDVHDNSTKERYRCPFPDCSFSGRQRTNLTGHLTTHGIKLPQTRKSPIKGSRVSKSPAKAVEANGVDTPSSLELQFVIFPDEKPAKKRRATKNVRDKANIYSENINNDSRDWSSFASGSNLIIPPPYTPSSGSEYTTPSPFTPYSTSEDSAPSPYSPSPASEYVIPSQFAPSSVPNDAPSPSLSGPSFTQQVIEEIMQQIAPSAQPSLDAAAMSANAEYALYQQKLLASGFWSDFPETLVPGYGLPSPLFYAPEQSAAVDTGYFFPSANAYDSTSYYDLDDIPEQYIQPESQAIQAIQPAPQYVQPAPQRIHPEPQDIRPEPQNIQPAHIQPTPQHIQLLEPQQPAPQPLISEHVSVAFHDFQEPLFNGQYDYTEFVDDPKEWTHFDPAWDYLAPEINNFFFSSL